MKKCQVCERKVPGKGPVNYPALIPDVYMCKTCWAIWYDGCCDVEEIKRHSLHWPINDLSAYAKKDYNEGWDYTI